MKSMLEGREKLLLFGAFGAAGCFLGAILGELLLAATKSPPSPIPRVDVLFVLDITSSMQPQIDGVRQGIIGFADSLTKRKLDARIGLVAFRDRRIGEEPQVLHFGNEPFTNDPAEFRQQVETLRANGGGDAPESSLDGVTLGMRQPFRPDATRVLVLITDAPPLVPDKETRSVADAAGGLRQSKIDQLHLVINGGDRAIYEPLLAAAPGEVFLLGDIAGGVNNFDKMLPKVGERIAEQTLKGLQSTTDSGPQSFVMLLLVTCLWTGALSLGVSLALIGGQNAYLHRPFLTSREALAGMLGGLTAGAIAGGVGQLFFAGASSISALALVGRIAAWAMLGGLVGRGMAFFVPNLPPRPALFGGGVGGTAAAVVFLISSAIAGDVTGRLLGAAILGFCIGVMIALVEAATRSLWLEVRYGAKEMVNVTLGATPISFGSDARACTIYARDVRGMAFRYKLEEGQVRCDDFSTELTTTVAPDVERQIGNLVVTVRSGTQTAGAGPGGPATMTVPLAPPPPVITKAASSAAPPPPAGSAPVTAAPWTGTAPAPGAPPPPPRQAGAEVATRQAPPPPGIPTSPAAGPAAYPAAPAAAPVAPGRMPPPPPPPAIKPPPPPPGRPAVQTPAGFPAASPPAGSAPLPPVPLPPAPRPVGSGPPDPAKIRPLAPPPPPPPHSGTKAP